MLAVVILVLFICLDIAVVILALLWLSERRAKDDITDMRFREWRRRIR